METKDFERQLKQQEQRLKQYERENERLTKSKETAERNLEEAKYAVEYMEKQKEESIKLARSQEEINAIEEEWAKNQEIINAGYEGFKEDLDSINTKLQANNRNISLTKDEIIETQRNLDSSKARDYFEGQSKGIVNVIKKVKNYALALIGIRSAYSAITRAISILSQNNKELKADLDYIKFAFAKVLEPLINKIVDWIYKLLGYINHIYYGWFGKNLFTNEMLEDFKKTNKEANKLQKTLASFDEANIVNKKNETPSPAHTIALGNDNIPQPAWVEWITKNKGLITDFIEIVGIAFGITKINQILGNIGKLMGVKGGIGLIGLLETLMLIGTSWVVKIAIENWADAYDKAKSYLGILDDIVDNLNLISNKKTEGNTAIIDKIKNGTATDKEIREYKEYLDRSVSLLKISMKEVESQWDKLMHPTAWEGFVDWINPFYDGIDEINKMQSIMNGKFKELLATIDFYDQLYDLGLLTTTEDQEKYKTLLEEAMRFGLEHGQNVDNLREKYEKLTGQPYSLTMLYTVKEENKTGTTAVGILETLKKITSKTWKTDVELKIKDNGIDKLYNSVRNTLSKIGLKLPELKLATGGIINLPNRGVPLGYGVRGGESGIEGVVPLTDSQAMAFLGSEIGKNVKIVATIPVYMGNRQVAREMRNIMAEDNFASNR